MGSSSSKNNHCPYYVFNLCKIENCPYKHDELYKPNLIKVLWHRPQFHPAWEYSIYTVDFNYFCTESNGHFNQIFKIKELKSIHIYNHCGIFSNRINLEEILPYKKFIFYNILHQYMIVQQLFNISDVYNYVALLMRFDKVLITTFK
jgi:hypothetical protein